MDVGPQVTPSFGRHVDLLPLLVSASDHLSIAACFVTGRET
jgi:hypothetical protein